MSHGTQMRHSVRQLLALPSFNMFDLTWAGRGGEEDRQSVTMAVAVTAAEETDSNLRSCLQSDIHGWFLGPVGLNRKKAHW